MPWNIQIPEDQPIVETVYEGILTPSELGEAAHQTIATAREHQRMKLLGDCSRLVGGHTVVDLFGLAELLEQSGLSPVLKEAIVLPAYSPADEAVRFWETTCLNRGMQVRIFPDRASALAWLLQ